MATPRCEYMGGSASVNWLDDYLGRAIKVRGRTIEVRKRGGAITDKQVANSRADLYDTRIGCFRQLRPRYDWDTIGGRVDDVVSIARHRNGASGG